MAFFELPGYSKAVSLLFEFMVKISSLLKLLVKYLIMNYANNKDNTKTSWLVTTDIVTKNKVIEIVSCSLINFKKKTLTFCYNDISFSINVLRV